MSYTEVSEQGWFSRIGSSIMGVLFGLALLVGSAALLWWNEGHSVHTMQDIAEARGLTASVPSDKVDAAFEGKLVHMQGQATTQEVLTDPSLGISQNALRLARKVEMYQWDEDKDTREEKSVGGSKKKITTYTYNKEWSSDWKDSSKFKEKGHDNPSWPDGLSDWGAVAKDVTMGAFTLTSSIVEDIDSWDPVQTKEADLEKIGDPWKGKMTLHPGGFYMGTGTAGSPQIGDVRITFQVVKPTEISLISQQSGKSFQPYRTKNGNDFQRVETGKHSKEEMFASAETENTIFTWVLRFVGWFLMFIGFCLVFAPLSVIADFIPFVGNMVGFGATIFSLIFASIGSMVVVAAAWFAYRPLLSFGLLAGAILLLVIFRGKKKA